MGGNRSIGAIFVAVGCYEEPCRTCQGWRLACFGYGAMCREWWPALNALRGAQVPILVGSSTVGLSVFLFGIPLAPLFADPLREGTALKCLA
jgi:hypothetical protein